MIQSLDTNCEFAEEAEVVEGSFLATLEDKRFALQNIGVSLSFGCLMRDLTLKPQLQGVYE